MNLFLVGLVSLLAQVVLLRESNVAFYGIELAYLFALAGWLAGTAAGAALASGSRGSLRASRSSVGFLLAAVALALPFDVALIRGSRSLLGGVPGAYLPIQQQLLVLLVSVVPMATLCGAAFTRAARAYGDGGGRLPLAYAIESAGAAAAGLASTFAFHAGVQTLALAFVISGVGAACLPLGAARRSGRRILVAAALVAAGVLAAWLTSPLDQWMTGWNHPNLAETVDTPYSRVTITRAGAQVAIFENDVLTYDSETASHEELAHLAALQHAAPARILLLGGTAERMSRELAKHRPVVLDQVEIDPVMVSAVGRWIRSPASPRTADPRAFLAAAGRYDVIVVATGEPVSGQSNRFYTREFFDECARRLAPGGVLGVRLQVPANYLGRLALLRAASVARALRGAFGVVEFLPGSQTIALASQSPLPALDLVATRLQQRQLDTTLITSGYLQYLYTNDRRDELHAAFAGTTVPENRDRRPVAYLYAATGWLAKFWPGLIGVDPSLAADPRRWPAAWRWLLPAALALAFAATRFNVRARRAGLAFAAGLAGMVLETVILLHYQARSGALFEDVGVLMMAFMAGSALGAAAKAFWTPRRRAALLLAMLLAWAAAIGWLVASGAGTALPAASVLLAGTGAAVGALFSCASEMVEPREDAGIGRLYAADVLGGCLGSIAASLALIPLAGLDVTAWLVAAFTAIALVGV